MLRRFDKVKASQAALNQPGVLLAHRDQVATVTSDPDSRGGVRLRWPGMSFDTYCHSDWLQPAYRTPAQDETSKASAWRKMKRRLWLQRQENIRKRANKR